MPHSSGGGSSSHGSHRSSRSKPKNQRYGNTFYRGASRFVYYRGGRPQYYYSDKPYTLQAAKGEKIKTIISNIFMTILGVILSISAFFTLPHKVKIDYNSEILISDSAQLLSETDRSEMNDAFLVFREKTGVTPAFFTIVQDELENQGGSLQKYAYRLYVNTFDDEKHWLVVYCIDEGKGSWSWEGMIGDDCGSIISSELEDEFTKTMQKNLERAPGMVAAGVINTFETIGNKAGKLTGKKLMSISFVILIGGYLLFLAFTAGKKVIAAAKSNPADDPRINSVQCPEAEAEPVTVKCEYCDGEFVVGLHTACPHCGAPLEDKWE